MPRWLCKLLGKHYERFMFRGIGAFHDRSARVYYCINCKTFTVKDEWDE